MHSCRICPVKDCGNTSSCRASFEETDSCLDGRETGLGPQLRWKCVRWWERKISVSQTGSSPLSECLWRRMHLHRSDRPLRYEWRREKSHPGYEDLQDLCRCHWRRKKMAQMAASFRRLRWP